MRTASSTSSSPAAPPGTPKGAALTHFNIVNNGFFCGEGMRLTAPMTACASRCRCTTASAWCSGVLAAMTHGAASVFPGEGFEPLGGARDRRRSERCTALHGVPTMFIAELEHPRFREFDLSSLRTGIMAGSPCPIAVMRRVIAEMHMPRGHDLLRHDGDQPGELSDPARRSARTARRAPSGGCIRTCR